MFLKKKNIDICHPFREFLDVLLSQNKKYI